MTALLILTVAALACVAFTVRRASERRPRVTWRSDAGLYQRVQRARIKADARAFGIVEGR